MSGPLANFSKLLIRELPKAETVYHATDSVPRISTRRHRLIPTSLSAAPQPLTDWGDNVYPMQVPAGAKVGELNSIFDLLNDGQSATPKELGKLLRKYADEQSLDALKIGNVGGVGTEWAVLNPAYVPKVKKR